MQHHRRISKRKIPGQRRNKINFDITWRLRRVIDQAPVWILFILGLWLVILRPLEPHLALVPGDLGDTRFNNYVLEHFFRWVTGLTRDYWNAPFFFPFQQTISFSDNLLGSAPFYVLFRWAGLDRASAFQGWYILGCVLNFAAASYVLWRLKLKPLAVGTGAFFFAFGLPLLAQENHAQLLYRFCVPLVCFLLWRFYQVPRLRTLVSLGAWLVWQFYLTIYMGIFLLLLLAVLMILLPFCVPAQTVWQRLAVLPRRLSESWSQAYLTGRILAVTALAVLGLGFMAMILPYYRITRIYVFYRSSAEISPMLPRLQSYLLADHSQLWSSTASIFSSLPLRHEHQLFPGLAVLAMVLAGIAGRFHTENRRLAWLHIGAALVLVALTLEVHGFSLYRLVWWLPGLNGFRAVTRIILVVMWPLSLFTAWAVDGFVQRYNQQHRWMQAFAYLITGLLVVESIFYTHSTYAKADAQARLDDLRQQIPAMVPANPVLIVVRNQQESFWLTEIDAMLLAQELGWPTLNGYSGNFPPGFAPADSCKQLPARIKGYMDYAGISSPSFYLGIMKRVVPLGFEDCDPTWWNKMP
jgi:hypothetical protein